MPLDQIEFTREALLLDAAAETDRIIEVLCRQVHKVLLRQGAVVHIGGGVNSSVVLGLAVHALGPGRVIPVILLDKDSDPVGVALARQVAVHFGVMPVKETIADALEGFGCYRRRDEALRRAYPPFDAAAGYTVKALVPAHGPDGERLEAAEVTIAAPDGTDVVRRLPLRDYLQIVAASNFRYRARMSVLYYHAELNNYAVLGTANRSEHEQGAFVKYGDSGVDVNAIGHLYKTQVHQLAAFLDVPVEVRRRALFAHRSGGVALPDGLSHPFCTADLLLFAHERGVGAADVARVTGLSLEQVERTFDRFSRKRRRTEYLRMTAISLGERPQKAARPSMTSRARPQ